MKKNKLTASFALQLVSGFLVIIALLFFKQSYYYFTEPQLSIDATSYKFILTGMVLLIVGVIGPARIIANGAQIPSEIKQTILVQAVFLPLLGAVLLMAELINTPSSLAYGFLIVAVLIIAATYLGFYFLSTKLPATFYLSEMLSIIQSASINGDKKDSPADREFMKWTNGERDGLKLGVKAPNGEVVNLDGEKVMFNSLFNKKQNTFTVINFASYTCPHHRKRIDELHNLMNKWQSENISFLTVYTAEAHPDDGWKLAGQYDADEEYTNDDDFCFDYAKTVEERIYMAKWLIEKKQFKMQMVVDTMDDKLLKQYNSWPIRLYIIQNDKVVYCGNQGPFGYEPKSVDEALQKLTITK